MNEDQAWENIWKLWREFRRCPDDETMAAHCEQVVAFEHLLLDITTTVLVALPALVVCLFMPQVVGIPEDAMLSLVLWVLGWCLLGVVVGQWYSRKKGYSDWNGVLGLRILKSPRLAWHIRRCTACRFEHLELKSILKERGIGSEPKSS